MSSLRGDSMLRLLIPVAGPAALAVALGMLAGPAAARAQTTETPDRGRVGISLGLGLWPDVGDLRPFLGGSFDDAGAAVDLAFHWPVARLGAATVLAGGNVGGVFHDSSVRGVQEGEDLQASAVYLVPSLKLAFGEPGGRQFYVDAGVGYYGAAIDEQEDDCFFSCDIYEYYDDEALGGFLGVSLDMPLGARTSGFYVTADVRAHFVDFDNPVELDSDSSLGGPIYTLQVGLAWRP